MTKEEAIAILIREIDEDLFLRTEYRERIHEAINMAIKALGQEPCEDAVSRQSMLDAITDIDDNINMDIYTNEVREIISALPSVIHTHKKGKWIKTKYWYSNYCSECNYKSEEQTNYCPNCGSRMEEPNKSEIPTGSDDYISAESESKRYMELAKSYAQGVRDGLVESEGKE